MRVGWQDKFVVWGQREHGKVLICRVKIYPRFVGSTRSFWLTSVDDETWRCIYSGERPDVGLEHAIHESWREWVAARRRRAANVIAEEIL